MLAIYKKELKSYFSSMIGYIFVAFMLIITGVYYTAYNLFQGYANIEYALYGVTFVYLIIIPILTMRIMAEEQRQKTDQLLYTAPVRVSDIVFGKYFALLTILLVPMLVVCLYPLILGIYGDVKYASAFLAIVGFFLLGAADLAIGMFISSITESQVLAAVIAFGVLLISYLSTGLVSFIPGTATISYLVLAVLMLLVIFFFYLMTKHIGATCVVGILAEGIMAALYFFKGEIYEGTLTKIIGILDCTSRYDDFVSGMIDLKAVVYFVSVAGLFIFLTVQSVQKRRWS